MFRLPPICYDVFANFTFASGRFAMAYLPAGRVARSRLASSGFAMAYLPAGRLARGRLASGGFAMAYLPAGRLAMAYLPAGKIQKKIFKKNFANFFSFEI